MTEDNQRCNEYRENLRGAVTRELAQLVARAASLGLVLTVEHKHASPLHKPGMVFEVRHARGFYLQEV